MHYDCCMLSRGEGTSGFGRWKKALASKVKRRRHEATDSDDDDQGSDWMLSQGTSGEGASSFASTFDDDEINENASDDNN